MENRPGEAILVPTIPVSAIIPWTETSACSFYMSKNWFVNYVRRQDGSKLVDRQRTGLQELPAAHLDEKDINRVFIREDFALCDEAWKCFKIHVEHVEGVPTVVMGAALQRSYHLVRHLTISNEFSSVLAILTVMSKLPSLKEVTISLNNSNVAQSEADIQYDNQNGCHALTELRVPNVHTLAIRSVYAINERVNMSLWNASNTRVSLLANVMFVVFSSLRVLKMSVFGDQRRFQELVSAVDTWTPENVRGQHRIKQMGSFITVSLNEDKIGVISGVTMPKITPPAAPQDRAASSSHQGQGSTTGTVAKASRIDQCSDSADESAN